ncbi:hypothetical protein [Pseudomonas amygdali]|uniref:hypothetical protein n=1 Tax=Pseudomonas amygdali TaxID=47877 RepID=UPI00155D89A1|nr:hypothetical protein [Pseudomonas amygdali]
MKPVYVAPVANHAVFALAAFSMHAPPSVFGGGKLVRDGVLRVTGMEPDKGEIDVNVR